MTADELRLDQPRPSGGPLEAGKRRGLQARSRGIVGLAVVAIALLVLPRVVPSAYGNDMFLFIMYSYLGICWNLVGGTAGELSLVHGTFYGLGGYASALLFNNLGVTPLLGAVAGAVGAALFAWIISTVAFKRDIGQLYFALLTLAFADIVYVAVHQWESTSTNLIGIYITFKRSPTDLLFQSKTSYYYLGAALVIVGLIGFRWIQRHRFGYLLEASKEDDRAARSLGVNVPRIRTLGMMISAAAASLGGVVLANYYLYVSAVSTLDVATTFTMLAMVIVGGLGRLYGPVVGALVITVLQVLIRNLPLSSGSAAGLSTAIYGLMLVLVISFAPGGLVGVLSRLSGVGRVIVQRGVRD